MRFNGRIQTFQLVKTIADFQGDQIFNNIFLILVTEESYNILENDIEHCYFLT